MIERVAGGWEKAVLRAVERGDVLDQVREVTTERGAAYGPPEEHWARTVGALNALFAHKLSTPFEVSDWPLIMVVDKLAREMESSRPDNVLDCIGYLFKRSELSTSQPPPSGRHP